MTRPLRLEFAGALYHITSRGDRREDIYLDDLDRKRWLEILGEVCERFNWTVHAYCQMTNHYHLLVETVDGNLSRGMRHLNGQYTQSVNRRHDLVGHLFQGRYKAILVQKEEYLLELSRYVVLNPVRARMVRKPERWLWSSYPAHIGLVKSPPWLDSDWLLSQFAKRRSTAISRYVQFVAEGKGLPSPLEDVKHQLALGDDAFVLNAIERVAPENLRDISKAQRRPLAKPLEFFVDSYADAKQGMADAYRSGAYTMREIGEAFTVHEMTVSRVVRKFEINK